MNTATVHDLAMESVDTLRRAAERSVRGLRIFDQTGDVRPNGREALRQFLSDSQADLQSLRLLRKIADELLREGIESEALLGFCEGALQAAEITVQGSALVEKAKPELIRADPENGPLLVIQVKESAEQAQAIQAYFHRLVAWLRTPPEPLSPTVFDKLQSLPPVTGPQA
jgi:hypothetical protein